MISDGLSRISRTVEWAQTGCPGKRTIISLRNANNRFYNRSRTKKVRFSENKTILGQTSDHPLKVEDYSSP